jgi:hypothetical protein
MLAEGDTSNCPSYGMLVSDATWARMDEVASRENSNTDRYHIQTSDR